MKSVFEMISNAKSTYRQFSFDNKKEEDEVIAAVLSAPRVVNIINELTGDGSQARDVVEKKAKIILRKMMNHFDEGALVSSFEGVLTHVFERIFDGVDVDLEGLERIKEAMKKGTVILLPSHKSHFDYLIIGYLFFKHGIKMPSVAGGDNLSFFPMGPLFQNVGAFFIRRKIAGDRLYATLLAAYVQTLMRGDHPIEFFIEGGRSRTGKLLNPKFGMLSMVVEGAKELERPTFFVPIAISYERVFEAKSYAHELSGHEKQRESMSGLLRSISGLSERYGRLDVQIGKMLTLDDVMHGDDDNASITKRLGHNVIYEINQAMPVTPSCLVALCLLSSPARAVSRSTIMKNVEQLLFVLKAKGARLNECLFESDGSISKRAIVSSLNLFTSAGWMKVHDSIGESKEPLYELLDDQRMNLSFSKNVILHYFVPYSLIAACLRMSDGNITAIETARKRVHRLSKLFKYEFTFKTTSSYDEIFDETLDELVTSGIINVSDGNITVNSQESFDKLSFLASVITPFIEGYIIAARTLCEFSGKKEFSQKDMVKHSLTVGKRMFLIGEITCKESISKQLIENAISSFVEQGYMVKTGDKLVPSVSFSSKEMMSSLEKHISTYHTFKPSSDEC